MILIVDAAANGLWGFMWFVAFVYLADQWRKTEGKDNLSTSTYNCANSGVAFSFFSVFIWVSPWYISSVMSVYMDCLFNGKLHTGTGGCVCLFMCDCLLFTTTSVAI